MKPDVCGGPAPLRRSAGPGYLLPEWIKHLLLGAILVLAVRAEAAGNLPAIAESPAGRIIFSGAGTVFNATATGAGPLTYQWLCNGTNIAGATNVTFALTNAQPQNAGNYALAVRNDFGAVTSAPAFLAVKVVPLPGAVLGWGENTFGQSSPPDLTNAVAIAGGAAHSLALRSDGTMTGWGHNLYWQASPPPGLHNVVAIAAGYSHSMALRSDGRIIAWSHNDFGQTTCPISPDHVSIASGSLFCLSLNAGGTVEGWGDNRFGQAAPPPYVTNAISIAAGLYHSLALRPDGTVVAWGDNRYGQANVPPALIDVVDIAAGEYHSMALLRNGRVVCWGYNGFGETQPPPHLTDVTAIAAGAHHCLALRTDGSVVGWGSNARGQAAPPAGLSHVLAIAAGANHSLALTRWPVILNGPRTQTVPKGTNVTLAVTVGGPGALHFQWQFNGTDLSGATNSTLTLTNLALSDAGVYQVSVSNEAGRIESAPAILAVSSPEFPPATLAVSPLVCPCGFAVNVAVEPGRSYRVQASSDLADWTVITNFVSEVPGFTFVDYESANYPQRFYRLVSP